MRLVLGEDLSHLVWNGTRAPVSQVKAIFVNERVILTHYLVCLDEKQGAVTKRHQTSASSCCQDCLERVHACRPLTVICIEALAYLLTMCKFYSCTYLYWSIISQRYWLLCWTPSIQYSLFSNFLLHSLEAFVVRDWCDFRNFWHW